jgi:hypothetical protein
VLAQIKVRAVIRFSLKCAKGHGFESWFASNQAYDALSASGQIACPFCGDADVEKSLMTPRVGKASASGDSAAHDAPPEKPSTANALSAPDNSEIGRAIRALRRRIEADTENVGSRFAAEARAIHEGQAPERAIRGEASQKEARALAEDGIPVVPLPFPDPKKSN